MMVKKIKKVVDSFSLGRLKDLHADFQHPRHRPLIFFLLFLFLVHPRLWSGGGLLVEKVEKNIANDLYRRAAGEDSPAALFLFSGVAKREADLGELRGKLQEYLKCRLVKASEWSGFSTAIPNGL